MDTSTVATRTVLSTSQLASGYRARRRVERVVVPPVDLTVASGELVTLLGPNGAGKSTLLRTISGVQPAMSGGVTLLGDPLDGLGRAERARRLASVLTERVSVGQLAGYDLVALGRQPHTGWNGVLDERDHRVVADAIVAVGGAHLAERDIGELSDGERQRLMIARALAQEPAVLILDEPTAFLDVTSRIELGALLQRLAHERGLGVVCSTHDLDLALATADTVWLLDVDAHLSIGAPEDLALTGAIGTVFGTADLEFDAERGTFSRRPEIAGFAAVTGDGLPTRLCVRALTRIGYHTDELPDGVAPDVTVDVRETGRGAAEFVVATNGSDVVACPDLRTLCEQLRSRPTLDRLAGPG
ncbi:MAG: ABC transporter ATP-binding protein [Actinomycetota bacterium]